MRCSGKGEPIAMDIAPVAAAVLRSAAACCLAAAGKSSLPSSLIVMLSKSIGQKGKPGRSTPVA